MMPSFAENSKPVQTEINLSSEVPGMIHLKEEVNTETKDDLAAFKKKVEKLQMMRAAGILSEDEFMQQKNSLLKGL